MLVRDIIIKNPVTVDCKTSIEEALLTMQKYEINQTPVVDEDNRYIGMLLQGDLVVALIKENQPKAPAVDKARRCVTTAALDTPIRDLLPKIGGVWPVLDGTGVLQGIVTRRDIYEALFKKCEQQQADMNLYLESSHNGILVVDRNGVIVAFNAAAGRIMRVDHTKVIGKLITEIEGCENCKGTMEVLRTGEPQISSTCPTRPDLPIYANRSPITKNGEVIGAIVVFQDLSELEAVSQELKSTKKLNKQLDAIIESIYDGIFITDGNGKVLRVNSAWERICGFTREFAVGRYAQELVREGHYTKSPAAICIEKGETVTTMLEILKGGNIGKKLLATATPVYGEDNKIEFAVDLVRDITELNELKEKLEETIELTQRYSKEIEEMRLQQLETEEVVAKSAAMQRVLELAARMARVDSTVLITGESGVGKGVIAKMIHKMSPRKDYNFLKINCGAIPENLLESELFGYEGGAFTGAKREGKPGMFELAENGTLFLDEIAEMPPNLQVKLLRVLEDQEIIRVGGVKPIKANVRIITATNRNLEEMVKQGTFREDLFYRLNVISIDIPPLRERKEDIQALLICFINKFNKKYKTHKYLVPAVVDRLMEYDWPGNVRELQNLIERLAVMVKEEEIRMEHLPKFLQKTPRPESTVTVSGIIPLKDAVEEVEKQILERALKKFGSTRKTADILRVDQSTIVRKLKRYNIS